MQFRRLKYCGGDKIFIGTLVSLEVIFLFPDLYTQIIYEYIKQHDGSLILYKDLMSKYKMSYPTIRKKVKWLIEHNLIKKRGRKFSLLPFLH